MKIYLVWENCMRCEAELMGIFLDEKVAKEFAEKIGHAVVEEGMAHTDAEEAMNAYFNQQ